MVRRVLPEKLAVEPDFDEYTERSHELNDSLAISEWFRDNPERTLDQLATIDAPVVLARETQIDSLTIATSHIALMAILHGGDFSQVPFLEAKSISDVSSQPYYPLAA